MKKINFAIGIHNHQPVGNFDFVFEEAYKKSYSPFLEVLKEYPWVKISLHYSGCLLEWLDKHHPELISQIKDMVKRGQVELITGGFYEPILAVLPDEDKRGQIGKLTGFIKEQFDYQARGMWLAERIWEPHLAKILAETGVEYIIVDDAHFMTAGLNEEELRGYYLTEEQGAKVKVFPISKKLRYFIPFEIPEKTIQYLGEAATESGDHLLVLADDGEKFGIWPGTYHSVYGEKWLERFFRLLKDNQDWINITTFSEYIAKYPARGRIYLPCASYSEMMEWALLEGAQETYTEVTEELKGSPNFSKYSQFLRGGFWRNFFVKYAESNNLHKKMLQVSNKVYGMSPKSVQFKEAQDELWRGQCNDAYWHGVFGGLYMPHLREALYEHLIKAQTMADAAGHKDKEWVENEVVDFDKDEEDDVLISNPVLNLYFDPAEGGSLFELDYKEKSANLTDILSRRKESYHEKIIELVRHKSLPLEEESQKMETIHNIMMVKEDGLEKYLKYDWYRRASLLDHFLPPFAELKSFYNCDYKEAGDFVNQPYEYKIRKKENGIVLEMLRNGHVWIGEEFLPVALKKEITVNHSSTIVIDYSLTNLSRGDISVWFGVEFGLMGTSGNDKKCYYSIAHHNLAHNKLISVGENEAVGKISMIDEYRGTEISLEFDQKAILWRFPLETISQSESGFEKTYQGSVIFPSWKMELKPAVPWLLKMKLAVKEKK
ncbi:MAG: alpha-amylase/4-alpha-glucanotransferase domain-containing protein [bacterium]